MDIDTTRNTLRCGKALFPAARSLSVLAVLSLLCGCIMDQERRASFAPPPPVYGQIPQNIDDPSYAEAIALNNIKPAFGAEAAIAARENRPHGALAFSSGCGLKDRFDRDLTFAYRFSDGRTQLGLDVASDLWETKFEGAKIAFRYKLQEPGKRERASCLYDSPVQGLIGSVYNELIERDINTVWDALEDLGL